MRKYLSSPTGCPIRGTLDSILGVNLINPTDPFDRNDRPNYIGVTEVDWDNQKNTMRDNEIVFVDETGQQWKRSDLNMAFEA